MEANKDGALQCLERARKAFRDGDIAKARRLANKSKRLFSTKEADGKRRRHNPTTLFSI